MPFSIHRLGGGESAFAQRIERSGEPFQVSEDELGQVAAVTTLEEVGLGFVKLAQLPGDPSEVFHLELLLAKRVALVGVETG